MKAFSVLLTTLALVVPMAAEERKTIYVDRMAGLESFVEKALQAAELPFDFIDEEKRPELKANLAKMHSAYGEILYQNKLGRTESHRLELRDVETNRVLAWHAFPLRGDDDSRRRAAEAFAKKVKKVWVQMHKQ
ncbi:MAG: hypothetical protein K2X03_14405 [Bryobacteraceae bacterium]|nr:hypothetical protein [Bryobacteraceae bacterium]